MIKRKLMCASPSSLMSRRISNRRPGTKLGGGGGGGGGRWWSAAGGWGARVWGKCSTIYSSPARFFFIMEMRSRKPIPLFWPGPVHSGSAN